MGLALDIWESESASPIFPVSRAEALALSLRAVDCFAGGARNLGWLNDTYAPEFDGLDWFQLFAKSSSLAYFFLFFIVYDGDIYSRPS